ncbi:MAG: signal recognition particle-docking protein FtsY [Calditrichaeota bacterium]|nr:MAG: signal recognition particle-docking protein FtsY [Calditrichota bacterium]
MKVFSKLAQGLAKTKAGLISGIAQVIKGRRIDENVLDELEELLILSDIGVGTVQIIMEDLRVRLRREDVLDEQQVIAILKQELVTLLQQTTPLSDDEITAKPLVVSIVGVNGTGKTTTIGKLANYYQQNGARVLLAAADTFRAAATDQLTIWANRAGVEIVHNQPGADPAAVAYDALQAAIARNIDILLVDTAGRLHTKSNLMAELTKIHKVLSKLLPGAPHEVFLVLDATTGQNGLSQAKQFLQTVRVTGIVLTKLDGTAKGGIVIPIIKELGLPVRFVGIGEKIEDLATFDAQAFVEALFQ